MSVRTEEYIFGPAISRALHRGAFSVGSGCREAHQVEQIQKHGRMRQPKRRTRSLFGWRANANDEKGAPLTVYGGGRLFVNWEDQPRAALRIQSLPNIASQVRWV